MDNLNPWLSSDGPDTRRRSLVVAALTTACGVAASADGANSAAPPGGQNSVGANIIDALNR